MASLLSSIMLRKIMSAPYLATIAKRAAVAWPRTTMTSRFTGVKAHTHCRTARRAFSSEAPPNIAASRETQAAPSAIATRLEALEGTTTVHTHFHASVFVVAVTLATYWYLSDTPAGKREYRDQKVDDKLKELQDATSKLEDALIEHSQPLSGIQKQNPRPQTADDDGASGGIPKKVREELEWELRRAVLKLQAPIYVANIKSKDPVERIAAMMLDPKSRKELQEMWKHLPKSQRDEAHKELRYRMSAYGVKWTDQENPLEV